MHRTARYRKEVSAPTRWMLKNLPNFMKGKILHYGEGRAYVDTWAMNNVSMYPVAVYEPYPAQDEPWKADKPIGYFDLCISVYVLNVLLPYDRDRAIWDMCNRADFAIAAVRTDKIEGHPMFDGVVTKADTFQKSYTREEAEEISTQVLTYNSSFAILQL